MNPYSFQNVMDHTQRDGNELVIPKGLMPDGKEFRVPVSGKMDAAMANTWHDVVRNEYERQQSEATEGRSPEAASPPAGGRQDRPSGGDGGSKATDPVDLSAIEAQLAATVRAGEERLAQIDAELDRLSVARRETDDRLQRARRALSAYAESD